MALGHKLSKRWMQIGMRYLPFADAATPDLPMSRLLRLSLFQVSVGMAVVLLVGTLNRVMIVELGVPAWLVAVMVSLPLVFAPARAVIGFKSDTHASKLGWRRVPFIWFGSLLQFGGFAFMPFSLLLLSGDTTGPMWLGQVAAALAFLLVGAGLHTTQTAGLALACDLSAPEKQPRVVALLFGMLLLGMVVSAVVFGLLLAHFSEVRLIQVVQGAALTTMVLNVIALWKQEPRVVGGIRRPAVQPRFGESLRAFRDTARRPVRQLVALGLGTIAFSMQDILLEPYGGQVLHLHVSTTTALSALLAAGGLTGFAVAAHMLARGSDPYRVAAFGTLSGLVAFPAGIFSGPLLSLPLFAFGTALIGFGAGLFAHCTLTVAMSLAPRGQVGLVLGVWGAVQASAAGTAVAAGGLIRDAVAAFGSAGTLGTAFADPSVGYSVVYHIETGLLFATLVAIGPLVRRVRSGVVLQQMPEPVSFGLARR